MQPKITKYLKEKKTQHLKKKKAQMPGSTDDEWLIRTHGLFLNTFDGNRWASEDTGRGGEVHSPPLIGEELGIWEEASQLGGTSWPGGGQGEASRTFAASSALPKTNHFWTDRSQGRRGRDKHRGLRLRGRALATDSKLCQLSDINLPQASVSSSEQWG